MEISIIKTESQIILLPTILIDTEETALNIGWMCWGLFIKIKN